MAFSWPNHKCEPVIITFNREKYLSNTLEAFASANIPSIRLHVLDNASTDNTAGIVEKYKTRLPHLQYHKNIYNIGGNGNIVRSVEISDSEYHWVIGDDDKWFLENVQELIEALESSHADIIRLGWLVSDTSRNKLLDGQFLAKNEPQFFAGLCMISSVIIKRNLIIESLPFSYFNIGDFFPQLVPIIRGVEKRKITVYSLGKNIMMHTPSSEPHYLIADLEFYVGAFRTSRFFQSAKFRAKFINEIMRSVIQSLPVDAPFRLTHKLKVLVKFLSIALYCRAFGIDQTKYLLILLVYGMKWRIGLLCVLFISLVIPPLFIRQFWKTFDRIVYKRERSKIFLENVRKRENRL
jgi:glycosyltransferase involved in cell wall biosynthesis